MRSAGSLLAARYGIVTAGDDLVTTVACCRPYFQDGHDLPKMSVRRATAPVQ